LIVYIAIADYPGLDKKLSVLYLVLRKKGCSQEEKEWMAKPPAAKQVGDGGWAWPEISTAAEDIRLCRVCGPYTETTLITV